MRTSRPHVTLLGSSLLLWAFAIGAVVTLAPPAVGVAYAAKKKKKKKKHESGDEEAPEKKSIKKEGELSPKGEVELDEKLGASKDLKVKVEEGKRPTLTPEETRRGALEGLLESKLDEEVKLAEELLQFESECEAASPIRYRLGDLYWEKSKRAFFKSNDFNTAEKERKKFEALMKKQQNQSISFYQQIIDECPGFSDYPKVLFYLGKALYELDRAREGAAFFKRIIQEHESSEWIGHAWFMVGEFYFNTENDAPKAQKAYKKAEDYPKSPMFGFAVYKQGWCYINTGDWDRALERFKRVIAVADDPAQELDDRQRSGLRKEALKDYVRSYSHIGNAADAFADFKKLGGQAEVGKMMENLGTWYISRDEHNEVIEVYKDLIKSYPASTRLPIFQGRIVNAASKLGDDKVTVDQAKKLTAFFQQVRKKQKGAKNDAEKEQIGKDLKEAEDIAENTLRALAMEYHKEAKKLRGKAQERAYKNAHDLYKHYLDVFPDPKAGADVNYVFFMRYYYSEVLYQLEKFLEAAQQYDKVIDMNPAPKDKREQEVVLRAAEDAVRAWDELVQDTERTKGQPKVAGTEPQPIPELYRNLIRSCERYKKYIGPKGDRSVEIAYKEARTYYIFNHFDKAAPSFNYIVKNHPEREEACYSANLVLDIYNGRKDYASLRDSTRAYLKDTKLACQDTDRKKFAEIEEAASFQIIKVELEEPKKYLQAGNAYMAFYNEYGKRKEGSRYSIDAVYNASLNYDLANRLDKANEVREFLVETFGKSDPGNKIVAETAYSIAASYERIVDFLRAADYYERFAAKYKDDKRTKDAIYNAGLYRATLGDFDKAKADRKLFVTSYPRDPDTPKVDFDICTTLEKEAEALEKGGKPARAKWDEAERCYADWSGTRAYASADPDRQCHIEFKRGEIARTKLANPSGYQTFKTRIVGNLWPALKKKGAEKNPMCAGAAAELKFRDLRDDFKAYTELKIAELNPTPKGVKAFDASVGAKVKARDKLIESYKEVVEIGVAENALASLFMIGEAYRDSLEKLLSAPIPNKVEGVKLSDDDKKLFRDQLRERFGVIEESAVEAYRICVDKANELGVYNRWSVKALEQLQKLRPLEYPAVLERLAGVKFGDPLVVQRNGPVLAEGERYKALELKLQPGAAPPKIQIEEPKPAAPPPPPPGAVAPAQAQPALEEQTPEGEGEEEEESGDQEESEEEGDESEGEEEGEE